MINDFELTYIADESLSNRIDITDLEDTLNNQLLLSKYGTAINKVFCTFLVMKDADPSYQNQLHYRSEDKCLEVAVRVNESSLRLDNKPIMIRSLISLLSTEWGYHLTFDRKAFIEDLNSLL